MYRPKIKVHKRAYLGDVFMNEVEEGRAGQSKSLWRRYFSYLISVVMEVSISG